MKRIVVALAMTATLLLSGCGLSSVGTDIPTCLDLNLWALSEMDVEMVGLPLTIQDPNIFNGRRGCVLDMDIGTIYACANADIKATASVLAGSIAGIDACYNRLN